MGKTGQKNDAPVMAQMMTRNPVHQHVRQQVRPELGLLPQSLDRPLPELLVGLGSDVRAVPFHR
jgi:hypothetical protein